MSSSGVPAGGVLERARLSMSMTQSVDARTAGAGDEGAQLPSDEPPSSTDNKADKACADARADVCVDDRVGIDPAKLAWFEERVHAALRELACAGEVRIAIVDDDVMAGEHRRAMGVDGTTDVITFDLTDGGSAEDRALDVDLLLCADEALRSAGERGIALERELLLYALHGVLHCLGHDDTDEASFQKMHTREDEVLIAIGVGATFDLGDQGGAS